jgi:hypothetical protein
VEKKSNFPRLNHNREEISLLFMQNVLLPSLKTFGKFLMEASKDKI